MTTSEATLPEYVNPPTVARMLGINVDKILTWIHTGELRAIDVSTTRGQRPRWRISRESLDAFLTRRSATPPPKKQRRRRKPDSESVTQYY